VALPKYAPLKLIQMHMAPLSRKQANEFVVRGWVRSVKLGTKRQCGRLYNVEDVEACLDRMALGHQPRRRRRQ